MAKKRKTKAQKQKASVRREEGFKIDSKWLESKTAQKLSKAIKVDSLDSKHFRADLTKTFVLTMLVLALELALWQYLN